MSEEQTTDEQMVILTVGDLRGLIEEVPNEAQVAVSVYDDRLDEWDRIQVEAAEVRKGLNAPAVLGLAYANTEQALA